MRRPTVLHVVEHWGRPSEGFVYDLVRSSTATRAVVAAQRVIDRSPAASWAGRVHDLSACRGAVSADPSVGARPTRAGYRAFGVLPVHAGVAACAVAERAAVVHAHFGMPAQASWRAARRLGLPFAVSLHGWDLLVAARNGDLLEAVCAADLVVTPSQFLADAAIEAGVDRAVLRVVPSGLDLARFPFRARTPPTDRLPVVTFAGRFAEKKGVLDAARALAAVSRTRPLLARFVGHGPLADELQAELTRLGLAGEIVDGRRPGAVAQALAETDLVLTASRTASDGDAETLGLVNLEAMACGAPLVTTRHGGIPEAVGESAVLVPTDGDLVAGLAAGVEGLLAAPESWAAIGVAGRERAAAHFELGARTGDLEELWLALHDGLRGASLPVPPSPRPRRPTASVVLVTHNRRELLDQALTALSEQTVPAAEVLVVDNGSDDGTADLLSHRAQAGNPAGLRVITREANLPVAQGRNLAVAAARGEVIAFTDDDCRPRPTWLEALLAGLREGVDIVQGRTTADPAQPLEPLSRTQWTPAEFGLYETCNIAYTRAALDAAGPAAPEGPFDLAFADVVAKVLGPRWGDYPFGEDTELGWRAKRAGAASRFSVHAVVDHEVFAPDPGLLLRRAALAAAFPVLVQRVPELRARFLWHGYVLGAHRARMWLAAGAVATGVARRDLRPLVLTLAYAARLTGVRHWTQPGGRRARLAAAGVLLRRDLIETSALLRGSRRARTWVL